MHARRLVLPIVLLAVYACLQWAPSTPRPRASVDEDMPQAAEAFTVTDPPQSIDELRRRVGVILEHEHIAGVSIALVDREGPIWVGGVGVRDRASGAPMEGDTVFRIGSLSKSVIALAVMRLVDQGKLDVDRPLREILPDLQIDNPWEDVAPVTLAQCLEHTAGFDDVRFNEVFTSDERISVRDTLALNPRSRRIRWRPGTRHGYSNVGYTVAARAIEVASGEPFDDYIRREIFGPLGITDADFGRTPAISGRLASGYMDSDEPIVFRPFAHRPSGGLLASASDLAKLVHFWIMRGDGYPPIVSRASLARIERSGTLPYPHMDSEYGFANYADVMHPVIGRGHDGGMPGFHASFRYFSDLGVGYAMLLNSNYTFRGYFEIRELLFAYLTKGRQFPQPLTSPSEPTRRPGATFFTLESPGNEVFGFIERATGGWDVSERDTRLRLTHLSGMSVDVVPAADGAYRLPREAGSSVQFTTNRDGTPIMLIGFRYFEASSSAAAYLRYAALGLTMFLLHIAPLWSAAMLVVGALRRRRVILSLVLSPAIAGLCCTAIPRLLDTAFFAGVIGQVHVLTVALCATTILFAIASATTLVSSVRWLYRPDRPALISMIMPLAFGIAFCGLALWLGANGWIGLRTWAW